MRHIKTNSNQNPVSSQTISHRTVSPILSFASIFIAGIYILQDCWDGEICLHIISFVYFLSLCGLSDLSDTAVCPATDHLPIVSPNNTTCIWSPIYVSYICISSCISHVYLIYLYLVSYISYNLYLVSYISYICILSLIQVREYAVPPPHTLLVTQNPDADISET